MMLGKFPFNGRDSVETSAAILKAELVEEELAIGVTMSCG